MSKKSVSTQKLLFKVGDKVAYVLSSDVLFTGTITEAEVKRGLKPYTLIDQDGNEKYAMQEHLRAI